MKKYSSTALSSIYSRFGLCILTVLAIGCQQSSGDYWEIKGQIKNAAGQKIMLAELPYASMNRVVVDSTVADSLGRFSLQTLQGEERMHQLFVQDGPGFLLINDESSINFSANESSPENFTIKGSPATESIRQLYLEFMPAYQQAQEASAKAQAIIENKEAKDSIINVVLQNRDRQQQALEGVFARFFASQENATAYFFALGMSKNFLPTATWQKYLATARKNWPTHEGLLLLK